MGEIIFPGHKIPAIENLGVAKDQDAIDFTDNDIQLLGNFPLSPRLRTLLLARNRVSGIAPTLPKVTPNLRVLIMNSNAIQELADLDPLAGLGGLTHLVLMDNPVARKEVRASSCERLGGSQSGKRMILFFHQPRTWNNANGCREEGYTALSYLDHLAVSQRTVL